MQVNTYYKQEPEVISLKVLRTRIYSVSHQTDKSVWFDYDISSLHWRHNGRDSVSHHQPHDCLLNRLFRRRSKKTSKLRVTGLCVGNSTGTGEFPAQMASNAENVSIWWRHHAWWNQLVYFPMFFRFNCQWDSSQYCEQWIDSMQIWTSWWTSDGNIFRVTGPLWGEFTGLGLNKWLSKQSRRRWFEKCLTWQMMWWLTQ